MTANSRSPVYGAVDIGFQPQGNYPALGNPRFDLDHSLKRGCAVRTPAVYSTLMEPHGLYRERKGWGTQHSVRVKYDEHQELDVAEDRYRARGYQPPFDQLPWKGEDANDNA